MRRLEQKPKKLKWQAGTRKTRAKLILVSAYLTPAQMHALSALVARTKVPASAYIRAGVELMLSKPELVQEQRP